MSWNGQRILIVGLGLSGWSMLRYLHARGAELQVCDSRAEAPYAAALAADYAGVPLVLGQLPVDMLDRVDMLAVSPGVNLDQPFFDEARALGLPLLGDIEIFARDNQRPVLAVTGSNGKSTVVTLLGEMARAAGRQVLVGGNIGTPALDLIEQPGDLIVLELSSFQLELTESLDCLAACILNISADHMDRYPDLAAYAAAKGRIFARAGHAVINQDDPVSQAVVPASLQGSRFSIEASADFDRAGEALRGHGESWLSIADLKLIGRHNHANVLACFALGEIAGLSREAMCHAARAFAGLPHRCEWVAERHGVRWINDSKGTNVGATLAALDGIESPVILLAGGQSKGGDFAPWRGPLADKGRAVLLYGEDAGIIAVDLAVLKDQLEIRQFRDLDAAVTAADELARPGDTVLLSPGCASFDQFSGYVQRGEHFAALVRALP